MPKNLIYNLHVFVNGTEKAKLQALSNFGPFTQGQAIEFTGLFSGRYSIHEIEHAIHGSSIQTTKLHLI